MFAQYSSRQIWLWLLGSAGLAAWLIFGIFPRHREVAKLREEIRLLNRLERDQATYQRALEETERLLTRAKQLLAKEAGIPPACDEDSGLFAPVAQLAQKAGIILTRFRPMEAQKTPQNKTAEGVQLSGLGSFEQIAQFLVLLESPPLSLHVVELTWRKNQEDGEILQIEAICEK
jgi:Tfp pilus assembly protein PilO